LPALAAIPGAIDAAFLVGPEDVAQYRGIDQVGVLRMDADAADELAGTEADILPAAASVARFVEAVAIRAVEADRGLAGAGIDHVGIRRRDGNRADGGAAHVAVRHAAPEDASILGLPDAARAGTKIEGHPVQGIARDRDNAAATRRTYAA